MIKLLVSKILFLVTLSAIHSPAQVKDSVVATVGDFKISAEEFKQRYENYLFATGISDKFDTRMNYLQNMIDEIIAYHFDYNSKILQNKTFKKEVDWLWKQTVLAYLKDQEIYAKITVSDSEARQAFRRMNQRIAVSHLFAKTKEEADELYDLLKRGFPFEELAQRVFSDSLLKNNGGYLGYFGWGDLDPAFEEKAFSMKIGEISRPVKTEFGYSIIRLEDKVERPLLTEYEYQTRKKKIKAAVAINKKRPAERAYIEKLIDLNKFNFNSKCLNRLFNELRKDFSIISIKKNLEFSNQPCVEYKGRNYSFRQLEQRIDELPAYHREKIKDLKSLKTVIKGFFLQDTLMKIAHEKGYDTLRIVKKKFNALKTNLFMNLKQIEVLKNVNIPDSVLHDFYKKHIDFFSTKKMINLEEIIAKDSLTADSLLNLIKESKDFGIVAKLHSINKISAAKNGHVGFVLLEKFGNFKNLFWSASPDKILGPIKLKNGWGLYRVVGKKDSEPIPFNKVREEVEILAKYFYRKEYFEKYLRKLANKVPVKINKPLLGSIKIVSLNSVVHKNNFNFEEK